MLDALLGCLDAVLGCLDAVELLSDRLQAVATLCGRFGAIEGVCWLAGSSDLGLGEEGVPIGVLGGTGVEVVVVGELLLGITLGVDTNHLATPYHPVLDEGGVGFEFPLGVNCDRLRLVGLSPVTVLVSALFLEVKHGELEEPTHLGFVVDRFVNREDLLPVVVLAVTKDLGEDLAEDEEVAFDDRCRLVVLDSEFGKEVSERLVGVSDSGERRLAFEVGVDVEVGVGLSEHCATDEFLHRLWDIREDVFLD